MTKYYFNKEKYFKNPNQITQTTTRNENQTNIPSSSVYGMKKLNFSPVPDVNNMLRYNILFIKRIIKW